MEYRPIESIQIKDEFQIFPVNSREVINAIKESMEYDGFDEATPLVVWGDVVIDGHTRFVAAQEAGLEEVPVIDYDFDDEEAAIDYAIHMQRDRRNLTDVEYFSAIEKLKEMRSDHGGFSNINVDNDKTKQVVKSPLDSNKPNYISSNPKQNERTRDHIAKQIGIGSKKVQEAITVSDHADEKLKEEVTSGEKSIHKAYTEVQEKRKEEKQQKTKEEKKQDFTKTKDGFFIQTKKDKPKSTMNKQENDSIEWAKWSWNPVTGCNHGCKYCYARDIAKRYFATDFIPTFYPDRLSDPERTKVPENRKDEEGIKNVFVCSMADLFGDWVPKEWIDEILESVYNNPEWNFIFLTKNPKRYLEFEWTENSIVGATIDVNSRVVPTIEIFERIEAPVKFISCEPLSERLVFNADEYDEKGEWLSIFDWVIIGGRSSATGSPAEQPEWEWVDDLHTQARNAGCKIYWKPNLTVRPKEYPELMK